MMFIPDLVQPALAAAMLVMCAALLTQWRAVIRLRTLLQGDLARIFEQMDLLRFDNQQLSATPAASATVAAVPTLVPAVAARTGREATALQGEDYAAALELASRGADPREITARCGLSLAEARILVAMHGSTERRGAAH
jgi:Protein of unknown function (DUF2802)